MMIVNIRVTFFWALYFELSSIIFIWALHLNLRLVVYDFLD